MTKARVLINAFHTSGGGGLVYLQKVLPLLATDKRIAWTLLAPAATLAKLDIPKNVTVWHAPDYGFMKGHVWEQLVLPFKACGFNGMLCNANFVPLLARKPVPILHTTGKAGLAAKGLGMKLYWRMLSILTVLSLLRAPKFFTIAWFLVAEYLPAPLGAFRGKAVYAPPAVEVKAGKPVERDENLIMAVGDYYAQKNYPTLLRAVAILRKQKPEVKLEIIGRPVDVAVADKMDDLIDTLGLADCVTLAGSMPHEALLVRMRQAAVLASCAQHESFNIPVLEAMAVGTPVVCAEASYQQEVGGEAVVPVPVGKGGDIPAAFAVALYGVLENRAIREALVRRGEERAAAFSWDATAKALADTMASLVARR